MAKKALFISLRFCGDNIRNPNGNQKCKFKRCVCCSMVEMIVQDFTFDKNTKQGLIFGANRIYAITYVCDALYINHMA